MAKKKLGCSGRDDSLGGWISQADGFAGAKREEKVGLLRSG
jgi:hypothetical protein